MKEKRLNVLQKWLNVKINDMQWAKNLDLMNFTIDSIVVVNPIVARWRKYCLK